MAYFGPEDSENNERIEKAVEVALDYGQTDGAHHKMWVIDQMLRILLREKYKTTIKEWEEKEEDDFDEEFTDEWDEGIAP